MSVAHMEKCARIQSGLQTAATQLELHVDGLHTIFAATAEEELATSIATLLESRLLFQALWSSSSQDVFRHFQPFDDVR